MDSVTSVKSITIPRINFRSVNAIEGGSALKLNRLRSIANNAVRDTIWTPEPAGMDPFHFADASFVIVVDLIEGALTPDMEGDSVEKYYKTMSRWFHDALAKEGIPLDVIESATITISPGRSKKCMIIAQGRTFESST